METKIILMDLSISNEVENAIIVLDHDACSPVLHITGGLKHAEAVAKTLNILFFNNINRTSMYPTVITS